MSEIVGIRFKQCGKIYDFEVDGAEVEKGDLVVVESELGLNIGTVIEGRHREEDPGNKRKKIIRKATEEDLLQREENKKLEAEAKTFCLERIMARGLPMKLICTEATLDRKRIIFYFTADKRIDFRELVKDLASRFKTRIEMRQIGVRDGARMIGSLGICGREVCCKRFLITFEPVSIKMAKKQELVLNTGKLSGVCGRLMCCLGYEYSETLQKDTMLLEEESLSVPDEREEEIAVVSNNALLPTEEPPAQSQLGKRPAAEAGQTALQPEKQEEKKEKRKKWRPKRRRKKFPPKTVPGK
ncbi:MAG: regulatory iron-sulfur-containing complex subunit RicT [Thermodesulfovibrionales bacterium]|nr:regulatory iron-sulfur-containing complex subunit RicT [Thermodesulfovibrionales bacterium]